MIDIWFSLQNSIVTDAAWYHDLAALGIVAYLCKPLQTVYLWHVLNLENPVSKDTNPSKSQNPAKGQLAARWRKSRCCWSRIWKQAPKKRATVNANYTPLKPYKTSIYHTGINYFIKSWAWCGDSIEPLLSAPHIAILKEAKVTVSQTRYPTTNWTKQMWFSIFLAITRPSGFWGQDLKHVATCRNHLQHIPL